jgi:hypothetical protein
MGCMLQTSCGYSVVGVLNVGRHLSTERYRTAGAVCGGMESGETSLAQEANAGIEPSLAA